MEREGSGTSQGPQKTCKDDQKQVNSLLKAIRPRVYITDSSSFKKLVQELTGNGRHVISSPTRATPTNELHNHVPVISIEDYEEPEVLSLGEDSWEGMQPSIDSQDSGIQTLSPLATFPALQTTWMTQQIDEFQYPEVDAWPVEIDSFSFDDVYSFQTEEEMLFSQYDLSELYSIL